MAWLVLRKQAFLSMALAALEVYKLEAFGLLIGRRRGRDVVVDNAVAYQSSKRDYDYVAVSERRARRLDSALNFLSRNALVGDFHSHPDFPDRLSRHDRKELLEGPPGRVSVLVLVRRARRMQQWRRNRDFSLSGTVGRRHFLKLRAYRVDEDGIAPMRIACDYTQKLNGFIRRYKAIVKELEHLERLRKSDEARKRRLRHELKTYFSA